MAPALIGGRNAAAEPITTHAPTVKLARLDPIVLPSVRVQAGATMVHFFSRGPMLVTRTRLRAFNVFTKASIE